MALFIGQTLSILAVGGYVLVVCWYHFYQSPWIMAGVAVFFAWVVGTFWVVGRALPDEVVDYQTGVIELPSQKPSQIMLADLKEVRLLLSQRTRKGNARQPIQFVLHNGEVIEGFGSYKFFRDISNYVPVYDTDGTDFYPKEVYFYSMLVLWGLSALMAVGGIISVFVRGR